jgi:hypothetical protein
MTNLKTTLTQVLVAAIFSLALLLPTAVQFAHTFEGHEHKACTDISTHLHEKQLDCSICDFHFSIFTFIPLESPDFTVFHSFQNIEFFYSTSPFNLDPSHYFLRGPPQLS